MRSKVTYGLLVGFLVFLITANPSGTGENGRDFLGWLSGGFDDTREFVGSLMGDEVADPETNDLGEVVIPTVASDEPAAPAAPEPTSAPAVDEPAAADPAAGDPGAVDDVSVVE